MALPDTRPGSNAGAQAARSPRETSSRRRRERQRIRLLVEGTSVAGAVAMVIRGIRTPGYQSGDKRPSNNCRGGNSRRHYSHSMVSGARKPLQIRTHDRALPSFYRQKANAGAGLEIHMVCVATARPHRYKTYCGVGGPPSALQPWAMYGLGHRREEAMSRQRPPAQTTGRLAFSSPHPCRLLARSTRQQIECGEVSDHQ